MRDRHCGKGLPHPAHTFWWTDSGGGHTLYDGFVPTEDDFRIEKGLTEFICPGVRELECPMTHPHGVHVITFRVMNYGQVKSVSGVCHGVDRQAGSMVEY